MHSMKSLSCKHLGQSFIKYGYYAISLLVKKPKEKKSDNILL